ncbi:MAG: PAS domain S-box protein [Nitrospira sp.]|nr:PAS domain S-box protein [Nitrospira sp.]MDH4304650.1 PAS domain S-box protein [Nitrospira sp.]MDH5193390.1 PAS domain S-box protein [Nitrospira sp.]
MTPKAAKKKRWVRARPRAPVHQAGDREANVVDPSRDEFFAEAFRLSPHPIGITELETGLCLEINDACLHTFGFRREDVIGRTTLMLKIWPQAQDRTRLVDRLRSHGTVTHLEVSMRTRHGVLRQFLISASLISLRGKSCILTIGNDITDRKKAEEALHRTSEELEQRVRERTADLKRTNTAMRESEERFRLFVDHAPAAIAMFDRDMRYLAASRRWIEDYRLTDEMLGRSYYDAFPNIPSWWRDVHQRGLGGEVLSADEDQFRRGDGSSQWITWDVRPWYRGDQVGGIIMATEDVTARVEAKKALHEREERSDQVVRLAGFGILDQDHRTGKVYWSPIMREIYGVEPDAPASLEGFIRLIHPEDRPMVAAAIEQVHNPAGNDLYSIEHRLLLPNGDVRWISFRAWTLFDLDGPERRPARTLGAMIDITKRKQAEEALKLSERRFASFMDNLHGFAWIKDGQGRYLYVNRLFQESLLKGKDWSGKTDHELWPTHVAEPYERNDQKVQETGVPLHTVEAFIQQGEVRHALVSKFPILDPQGEPALIGGVAVDITERQSTEELLKQQADMLNHSSDAILAWKIGGGIVYWNHGAEELYGWRAHEVIGRRSHQLLSTNPLLTVTDMETCLAREGRWSGELSHVTKDGRQVIVESRLVRVTYGETDYALESNRDITKRKSADEILHRNQLELHQQQVQLEELTSKLLTAQERERQRIARDLHDDVSQRLAALVLEVASLEQYPASLLGECGQSLAPIREQLEQLSDDVHTLAYRLHPSLLEHAGLCPAVEDHVHQVSRRAGLPISLKIAGVPTAISLDHATCLFRVMQESVQNVVKHANATTVTVQLRGSTKGVGLSVTDNGKGFDLRDHQALKRGLGLSSMEERLRQLQGYFQIQSQPDGGTKVCAWVPYEVEFS